MSTTKKSLVRTAILAVAVGTIATPAIAEETTQVRVSRDRERTDRMMVNTKIGGW